VGNASFPNSTVVGAIPTATSDARLFLNCKEVIDALAKAGALALASKLESKCRHQ
jgi:hypothetical protein